MPLPPPFGTYEEVLQVDPAASPESGVVVVEQRKADRLAVSRGDHDLGLGSTAEQRFAQILFRSHHFMGQPHVIGQRDDHVVNHGNIRLSGGFDPDGGGRFPGRLPRALRWRS